MQLSKTIGAAAAGTIDRPVNPAAASTAIPAVIFFIVSPLNESKWMYLDPMDWDRLLWGHHDFPVVAVLWNP
ncbi:hypothetical protein KTU01_25250 [Kocuria turfanensis]|uniref:Uncharacterized protein n=1 Tax=Kocuria turfanensis TaxID=388357 RepID=A0A512IFC8_9MICC|nr:hypothetical protein KTU01_25250 [Kocuria turfanensis]